MSLVELNPPAVLKFNLERNTQVKATLTIKNLSDSKVVFKVKTTQPSWYYVRPNQQILDVDQTESVQILVVEGESNKFLDQIAKGEATENIEKHRFLVQSKVIDESEFYRIRELPQAKKQEELSKLWEKTAEDKKSSKLKVEFNYSKQVSPSKTPQSSAQHIANVTERLNPTRPETTNGAESKLLSQELQNMRKKYDDVVEYTVHLTSERDNLLQQLEVAQKELNKEKAKRKDGSGQSTKLGEKIDKKQLDKGFSLFVVLITALICFLVGKYIG